MSGFGAFCPLPLRLGGTDTDGWTAAQHARASADLAAVGASAPQAVITIDITGSSTTSAIVGYLGFNGVGAAHAPTLISTSPGFASLTWPKAIEDEYGNVDVTSIRHARVTAHDTGMAMATVKVLSPEVIIIRRFNNVGDLANGRVTITVSGWPRGSRIGHYDGAIDKENATRETGSYAFDWYNEYTAALGSGFTPERTGLVHCRKLALSRLEASVQRAAEKVNANSHPNTADDMLGEWVEILKAHLSGEETRQEIRQLCAAKFIAATGNDRASIDALCQRLLGQYFVGVTRIYGVNLDTPPTNTFWPGINPSLPTYDLGGGTWYSERSTLLLQVNRPSGTVDAAFDKLLNVDVFLELDRTLPAWANFRPAVLDDGGYHLDVDPMDGKGMTS